MSLGTLELPLNMNFRDMEQLKLLRLKRWQARNWMRSKGIKDLGSRNFEVQRITQENYEKVA